MTKCVNYRKHTERVEVYGGTIASDDVCSDRFINVVGITDDIGPFYLGCVLALNCRFFWAT